MALPAKAAILTAIQNNLPAMWDEARAADQHVVTRRLTVSGVEVKLRATFDARDHLIIEVWRRGD